jgi:hypothetical protein
MIMLRLQRHPDKALRHFEQRDFVEAFAWKKKNVRIIAARNLGATKSTVELALFWFPRKTDVPHKR